MADILPLNSTIAIAPPADCGAGVPPATDRSRDGCTTSPTIVGERPPTVRDLRRRWKPHKVRLDAIQKSHPTNIRLHRAFSWLARVEALDEAVDLDLMLTCRWIAFNALYGQWDAGKREPRADKECWKRFLDQVLAIDRAECVGRMLVENKRLVLCLLDDKYLSQFFWRDPQSDQAHKPGRLKREAATWFLQKSWTLMLDFLVERVYLMRCQLVHGAATYGGKLNRDSLRHCARMLEHLLAAVLRVIVEQGADRDWGAMCYPPQTARIHPR